MTCQFRPARQRLADEPALADAGLPRDLDDGTEALERSTGEVVDRLQLRRSAHELDDSRLFGRLPVVTPVTDRVAEQGGGDRLGLTLDQERFQRVGVERRSGALEDRGRHDDLARPRLLHQSCREVDRIAHHREGPARRAPEIADVHMAPVCAGPQRQGRWPREVDRAARAADGRRRHRSTPVRRRSGSSSYRWSTHRSPADARDALAAPRARCRPPPDTPRATPRDLRRSTGRRCHPALTNAIATCRCSPSAFESTCSINGVARYRSSPSMPRRASSGRRPTEPTSAIPRRRGRAPSADGLPSQPSGTKLAVVGLSRICPRSAAASKSTVRDTAGPPTSSSRWPPSTSEKPNRPECAPCEMPSRTCRTEFVDQPWATIERMRSIAATDRRAWSSSVNSTSSASPPNLTMSPPRSSHASIIWPKQRFSRSVSSSAPSWPRPARRSESAVKPLMSADTRVPSKISRPSLEPLRTGRPRRDVGHSWPGSRRVSTLGIPAALSITTSV